MRIYSPHDKQARSIARFNGWLLLGMVPLMVLFGLNWYFENPTVGRLLLVFAVPSALAACCIQAIRWGKGLC